jgi:hypothetical protein
MMTTARNHPIQAWINCAITFGRPPHISNLENLVKKNPRYIRLDMEHIAPQVRPPWWELNATKKLSSLNKEDEARAHMLRLRQIPTQDLVVYTDGSGHNGHIGAEIYSRTLQITKGKYIGTEDTHNVYAAELMAIQMAVTLFESKIEEYSNIDIFTDNPWSYGHRRQ